MPQDLGHWAGDQRWVSKDFITRTKARAFILYFPRLRLQILRWIPVPTIESLTLNQNEMSIAGMEIEAKPERALSP